MDRGLDFSWKFYLGVVMIIASLVLGKIAAAIFILYLDDATIRWLSAVIYILTWPLLFIGIWWVGKEYYDSIRRYASYRFYHESLKKGTQKAIGKTKELKSKVQEKVREQRLKKVHTMIYSPLRKR